MSDLTKGEQACVRAALHFLKNRCGRWDVLAKALRVEHSYLATLGRGGRTVSASVAVRVARLAGVGVDDVLAGRFPRVGTCPHCGHHPDGTTFALGTPENEGRS